MRGPDPPATTRSRALRRNQTDAEARLWYHLRDRQLAGCKFRRQVPLGPYFADFVCLERRLIIEVDGGQHAERMNEDAQRSAYLNEQGYTVLRFWNDQVLRETEAVLEEVLRHLRWGGLNRNSCSLPLKLAPHPSPLPASGERELWLVGVAQCCSRTAGSSRRSKMPMIGVPCARRMGSISRCSA